MNSPLMTWQPPRTRQSLGMASGTTRQAQCPHLNIDHSSPFQLGWCLQRYRAISSVRNVVRLNDRSLRLHGLFTNTWRFLLKAVAGAGAQHYEGHEPGGPRILLPLQLQGGLILHTISDICTLTSSENVYVDRHDNKDVAAVLKTCSLLTWTQNKAQDGVGDQTT